MTELNLPLKKLVFKIIVVYSVFLLFALSSACFVQFQIKKQIIESSVSLVRDNIINDNRRDLIKSLTQLMSHFSRIEFLYFNKIQSLILPEEITPQHVFNLKITNKIYLDSNKKVELGTFVFEYSPWFYIWSTMLFWMLLSITAIPWFYSSKNQITMAYQTNLKYRTAHIFANVASQVSHDIRSPLTVLNLIASTLNDIPEDQRLALRSATNRINDIANHLLERVQNKQEILFQKNSTSELHLDIKEFKDSNISIELLPAIIDMLVSEKRIQFRTDSSVSIETDLAESYGAFAKINSIEFKRVISNLINNAVEAIKRPDGRIVVAVKNYDTKIIVSIRDNGSGIPSHILEQLGQQGVTYGKAGTESGSGLGVYHAKRTIESFDAKFVINSRENFGTEIRMEFPKCETPNWFVPELKLKMNQTIVALDDDSSVLELWKQRFKDLNNPNLTLLTYTSELEFTDWVSSNTDIISESLFLMDFELLGQKNTGLQLIEQLDLCANAILVTSRYEEPSIVSKCSQLGVRLLPKGMAGLVPIEIGSDS